ncbi:ABC transporter substrate-binding protein [Candidatus Halobonum tyrrellensis]|uniref:Extracellular solute-binding protein family 5 n=1 Tax=Candidatus Halobonum tyrrellensis G22 TaxID=1324957 RepID=V4GW71_9EURY|nr:ABC transporter substrate-binding protein [Candidatus Halobonum tyrrellensis]ESP89396.1 extracellular solute-binding protein family 5 [Candidatus Halobonum tyrrellensis G22]
MSDNQTDSGRRRFMKGTGVAAVSLGLAGCSGGGDEGTETTSEGTTSEGTETTESTPTEAGSAEDIEEGGIFNFGMGQPPNNINPIASSSAYSGVITDRIYESGAAIDPVNFEMHPNVFTDWTSEEMDETGDDDQPNVRLLFNVRTDGLTWNDGTEFTAEQVVWSYNYLLEQMPGAYVASLNAIDEVSMSDESDWDCEMILNSPVGTFAFDQFGIPILPKHKWEGVSDFSTYQPYENDGPVGLGPGVVTQYQPDTSIEVSFAEREGEYNLASLPWREEVNGIIAGGPFIDAMRISVYSSESALTQAFLEGEIDSLYDNIRTSSIDEVENTDGVELVDGFDTGYSHVSFNLRRTPLDDLPFRQVLGFAFDDVYWVQQLQRGYAQKGDFVMPPGYTAVRPETSNNAELLTAPATNAFDFRQGDSPGAVDVDGVRSFLTEGQMITGEGGTYAGFDYPGSLTGVTASQTEPKHEYTFGPVESSVLRQSDADPDQEIRVDGETITSINDGPLTMFVDPPQDSPQMAKMTENWVSMLQQIGIPVEQQVLSFNTALTRVYSEENFDMFEMGWVNLSPFATNTLYGLFHSDNADDHSVAEGDDEENNTSTSLNNPMGYGLFEDATADDLISTARTSLDTEARNAAAREAVEKIYLDFPTMVTMYNVVKWPVNSAEWDGFLGDIPGPGSTYLGVQMLQVHQAGSGSE